MDRLNKLVSRSLKQQPLGPHPAADTLAAFSENALTRPERQQTLAHLAECADCREIIYLLKPDRVPGQETLAYRPNRVTYFAWRWGAVAASLVIVAGGLFLTRYELWTSPHAVSEHKPASPAYYDKMAENKTPPDFDSTRNAEPPARPQISAALTKTRPTEKHMTAKPQANMSFDEGGQVRVLNKTGSPGTVSGAGASAGMDAGGILGDGDKKRKDRNDLASPSAPPPSVNAVGSYVAQDTVATKNMPRATNQSVEVSSAAPVVQADNEPPLGALSAKLESSRQEQSDPRALKQNGAMLKALALPIAEWQLSQSGGVQRSLDTGKTWESVDVGAKGAGFQAIFSSGTQVWVGGAAGSLYHSIDSGLTWTQVIVAAAGEKLQSDIRHIQFSDPQNGAVTATSGETWLTSNGGQTWRKK